jgi:hypothetical protein
MDHPTRWPRTPSTRYQNTSFKYRSTALVFRRTGNDSLPEIIHCRSRRGCSGVRKRVAIASARIRVRVGSGSGSGIPRSALDPYTYRRGGSNDRMDRNPTCSAGWEEGTLCPGLVEWFETWQKYGREGGVGFVVASRIGVYGQHHLPIVTAAPSYRARYSKKRSLKCLPTWDFHPPSWKPVRMKPPPSTRYHLPEPSRITRTD